MKRVCLLANYKGKTTSAFIASKTCTFSPVPLIKEFLAFEIFIPWPTGELRSQKHVGRNWKG